MNASAAALTALATAVGADHREIDALFRTSRCTDLYVDVGSNRGVQLRKLYEPDKYKGAPMLSIFRRRFGGAGTSTFCHVCAIGIEANPRHSDRLNELQRRYRAAGIPLLILHPVAASDADGVALISSADFSAGSTLATRVAKDADPTRQGSHHRRRAMQQVRSADLSRILLSAYHNLANSADASEAPTGTMTHRRRPRILESDRIV